MESILARIEQIVSNESITITALERKIGASKGVLSRAIAKNTDIQSKWLILIVENYPLYSTDWLLTGHGEMLKKESLSTPDLIIANLSHNEAIIALLKEQTKEKDAKIETQAQEIGALKSELSKMKEEFNKMLFKTENIDQSSLFKSPAAISASVPSKKTSKANKKQ